MASNPTISISTSLRRRCDDGVRSSSQEKIAKGVSNERTIEQSGHKAGIREIRGRWSRDVSGLRQPQVQLLRAQGSQGDTLRRHDGRRSARSRALSLAGLDHLLSRWDADILQGLDSGKKLQLAQIPRGRPGMGAYALPAPVDDLRNGAEHH